MGEMRLCAISLEEVEFIEKCVNECGFNVKFVGAEFDKDVEIYTVTIWYQNVRDVFYLGKRVERESWYNMGV